MAFQHQDIIPVGHGALVAHMILPLQCPEHREAYPEFNWAGPEGEEPVVYPIEEWEWGKPVMMMKGQWH